MCKLIRTFCCVLLLHICIGLDSESPTPTRNARSVIKDDREKINKNSNPPYPARRFKRQSYRRDNRRQSSRGDYIEQPRIQVGDRRHTEPEPQFDFPFPDFNDDDGASEQTIYATPDGFPINPEDFGLDWESILNEPSVTEIHTNLTNLERTVGTVKNEQYTISRSLDRVMEEMGTLKADMDRFQKVINDSLSSLKKVLSKYDRRLDEGKRSQERLQRKITLVAEMPVNKQQILYMKNVSDSTRDYTKKNIQKVRKKMNSLENNISKLRSAWGSRIKDVSTMVKEVRGTGKQHQEAISSLSSNVSSLRNGVKVIQRSTGFSSRGGNCESGTMSFVNYPFNSSNWPQTQKIKFKRKFNQKPSIAYGVTAMDTSYRYNTRLRIQVQRVTPSGFTLYCSGWHNSRLYQVDVAWMAC